MPLENNGSSNTIIIGENVSIDGVITGNNNKIVIGKSRHASSISIFINGDGNNICIEDHFYIRNLSIRCGSHVRSHNTHFSIGKNTSIEKNGAVLLYNSGNKCSIGSECLISSGLVIRCGESPHLIFDRKTGEYLDISGGVFIGNHVWIGERVYITKRASIPNESVVAACSVVTRRFETEYCAIAGNPAKVVREDIEWVRNHGSLEKGSVYKAAFDKFNAQFPLGDDL